MTLFGVMAAAALGLRGALDPTSAVWMGASIEIVVALSLVPLLVTVVISADRRAWSGAALMTASVPGLLACVRLAAHAFHRSQLPDGYRRLSTPRYTFELLRELAADLWYGAGLISVVTLIAIAGARLRLAPPSMRGAALTGLAALPLALLIFQPMVPPGAVALVAATLALPLAPDRVRLSVSVWLAAAVATAWAASHLLMASDDIVDDPYFLSPPEDRGRVLQEVPIIVRRALVGAGGLVAAMLPVAAAWWMQRRTPSTRFVCASIAMALTLGAGTAALAWAVA